MTTLALRIGRVVLGVACLMLGVAGLFLPFLQGVLFLVIGLSLLSAESDRARRLLDWLRARLKMPPLAKIGGKEDGE